MDTKEKYFKSIVNENKDKIYRICCYYLSDKDSRQDLYQEILVNIWKSLDGFRKEAAISTWIYRIAVNSSLMFIYKERKRKPLNNELNENIKTEILPISVKAGHMLIY